MNTRQLNGTTSHTPPQQQTTLEPERLGDVDQGAPAPESDVDELGLTASEREAWDAMEAEDRNAAPQPGDPEPAEGTGEAPPAPPAEGEDDEDDEEDDQQVAARDKQQQPQDKQQPQKPEKRTVSRHKYSKDLSKREAEIERLRNELNLSKQDFARLNERLTILNEALTAPAPVDPQQARQQAVAENPWLEETIKVEDDAIAALAQMQRRQDYNNRQQQAHQEEFTETREDQQLREGFNRDIQRFSSTEEGQNFGDAYAFLKNSRLVEISVSLFDKDPTDENEVFTQAELNQIIDTFNSEEKWVVGNAMQAKKSPAAAVMKLARSRGWKPPEAAPAPAPTPPPPRQQANGVPPQPRRAPNGGAPAPQPPAPAPQNGQPTAAERIAAEQAGMAAARSLSDGGGAPPMEPLSIEQLLRMPEDEFGALVDGMSKDKLDRLMGKEQPRAY